MVINLIPLLPEIFLSICAMGLLIVGAHFGNESSKVISWYSALAAFVAIIIMLNIPSNDAAVLNGLFKLDLYASVIKIIILIGVIASIALSVRFLIQEGISRFEYPILILLSAIGMMIMVSANSMLSLYVGLELQSLALYVLAAFNRNSLKSSESGIKYFILGALSSGLLLFGISLIYGFTGTIDFAVLQSSFAQAETISFGVTFGLVFILAGLAFKISAVPFHMWTPDVYQGAPSSVTAFFAMVPKIAAMALLMRLLFEPFIALEEQWVQIIYFLSVASMVVGAFAAIAQKSLKRLIAYSSIGNMGYVLIGIVAGSEQGVSAVVLYLLIYMVMTAGVFAVLLCMRRDNHALDKITDLSGLSRTSPAMAYCLAILMFSLAGIPPFAGFFGKLAIFNSAVTSELYILAIIGVLTSVIGAYYYLRIIKVMFFDEPEDEFDAGMPFARKVVLMLSVLFVVCFILKPSIILDTTQAAASSLFSG
ncbi:MAG: NADH-quinone oxidoreductase subunit NuoN [Bdellovibrionales bacterium]